LQALTTLDVTLHLAEPNPPHPKISTATIQRHRFAIPHEQ